MFFFRSNDRPLIACALVCTTYLSPVRELCHVDFFKFECIFVETDIDACTNCLGPYHVESTSSRPITEVKVLVGPRQIFLGHLKKVGDL